MLAIGRLLPVIGDSVLSSPQNLLLWPLWFRKLVKSWSCQMWRSFQVIHQCRLEMYIVNAISVLISLQLEFPIDGLVSALRIYAIRATCCKRDFNHCSMRRWTDLRLPHPGHRDTHWPFRRLCLGHKKDRSHLKVNACFYLVQCLYLTYPLINDRSQSLARSSFLQTSSVSLDWCSVNRIGPLAGPCRLMDLHHQRLQVHWSWLVLLCVKPFTFLV